MGKRKGRKEIAETLIPTIENEENERDDDGGEEKEGKGGKFFACYLLTSLCPRFKGHTYIGFTVNPRRRIRQHNGEIGCGAWRTKRKRPWEMVVCIYGFPTNVAALQFEWAWQHPVESLAVRKAAASFKSLSGVANKIKLAFTMLTLPGWNSLNLTMNFFSTKYQKFMSGCPSLPEQMRTRVCIMDDLPCYNDGWDADEDFELSSQESIREEHVNDIQINQNDDSSFISDECMEETHEELRWNLSPIREESARKSILDVAYDSITERSISPLVFKEELAVKSPVVVNSSKIEVIDLFTPSPCHAMKSCSKKRRPTVYPEIIDLTNSPLFV